MRSIRNHCEILIVNNDQKLMVKLVKLVKPFIFQRPVDQSRPIDYQSFTLKCIHAGLRKMRE